MNDLGLMIIILFGPLCVICAGAYALAFVMENPTVARVLRLSAYGWFSLMSVVFVALLLATQTCSGDMFYGYTNCTLMPLALANLTLFALLVTVACGALYGVLLLIGAVFFEIRFRRQHRDTVA